MFNFFKYLSFSSFFKKGNFTKKKGADRLYSSNKKLQIPKDDILDIEPNELTFAKKTLNNNKKSEEYMLTTPKGLTELSKNKASELQILKAPSRKLSLTYTPKVRNSLLFIKEDYIKERIFKRILQSYTTSDFAQFSELIHKNIMLLTTGWQSLKVIGNNSTNTTSTTAKISNSSITSTFKAKSLGVSLNTPSFPLNFHKKKKKKKRKARQNQTLLQKDISQSENHASVKNRTDTLNPANTEFTNNEAASKRTIKAISTPTLTTTTSSASLLKAPSNFANDEGKTGLTLPNDLPNSLKTSFEQTSLKESLEPSLNQQTLINNLTKQVEQTQLTKQKVVVKEANLSAPTEVTESLISATSTSESLTEPLNNPLNNSHNDSNSSVPSNLPLKFNAYGKVIHEREDNSILLKNNRELISRLEELLPLSKEEFTFLITPILVSLSDFIYFLPASESYHHEEKGGLFRHSLECGFLAVQYLERTIPNCSAPPMQRMKERIAYTICALVVGLLHDIGKVLTDIEVLGLDEKEEESLWFPTKEGLYTFLVRNNFLKYTFRYKLNRGKRHETFAQIMVATVTPKVLLDYLLNFPKLLEEVYFALNNQYSCLLYTLMKKADMRSVELDLKGRYLPDSAFRRKPNGLNKMLLILQDEIRINPKAFNSPNGLIYLVGNKAYLSIPQYKFYELLKPLRKAMLVLPFKDPLSFYECLIELGIGVYAQGQKGLILSNFLFKGAKDIIKVFGVEIVNTEYLFALALEPAPVPEVDPLLAKAFDALCKKGEYSVSIQNCLKYLGDNYAFYHNQTASQVATTQTADSQSQTYDYEAEPDFQDTGANSINNKVKHTKTTKASKTMANMENIENLENMYLITQSPEENTDALKTDTKTKGTQTAISQTKDTQLDAIKDALVKAKTLNVPSLEFPSSPLAPLDNEFATLKARIIKNIPPIKSAKGLNKDPHDLKVDEKETALVKIYEPANEEVLSLREDVNPMEKFIPKKFMARDEKGRFIKRVTSKDNAKADNIHKDHILEKDHLIDSLSPEESTCLDFNRDIVDLPNKELPKEVTNNAYDLNDTPNSVVKAPKKDTPHTKLSKVINADPSKDNDKANNKNANKEDTSTDNTNLAPMQNTNNDIDIAKAKKAYDKNEKDPGNPKECQNQTDTSKKQPGWSKCLGKDESQALNHKPRNLKTNTKEDAAKDGNNEKLPNKGTSTYSNTLSTKLTPASLTTTEALKMAKSFKNKSKHKYHPKWLHKGGKT